MRNGIAELFITTIVKKNEVFIKIISATVHERIQAQILHNYIVYQ